MSTLTAPQAGFNIDRERVQRRPVETSSFLLVVTYALMLPLVFFAARGAFSFQGISGNSAAASAYGAPDPNTGKGNALHSAELIVSFGITVLALFPVYRTVVRTCRENAVLLLLPVWSIFSVLWSTDPTRTLSFGMLALLLTIFGVYIPVRFTPRQQMQLILFTGLIATVASLALVAVLPSAGIDYKNATVGFEGIYPQKNICSVITVMLLTPAFFYRFTGSSASVKRIGYFVLLIALIIGTRARTGWIVLALVVLFIVLSKFLHRLRPLERVLVTAFLPAVGLLASYLIYDSRFAILKFLGKDPSLSGRTGIWAVMFLAIVKRPLTGFGYAAFWTVTNPEAHRLALAAADPGLNNAENGILQLWLEIGLIGVLILGYLLFRTTKNAITCFRSDTPNYALWYMSILFITLLGLGDGSKFMVPTSIEWVLYILCDIGLAREAQRVRSARTTWA